jgi:hypothetical protein
LGGLAFAADTALPAVMLPKVAKQKQAAINRIPLNIFLAFLFMVNRSRLLARI